MEEGKKKLVMIVFVVACLALAGIITHRARSGGAGGGVKLKRGEKMIWLKCRNPDCGASFQMDEKNYFDYLKEHRVPGALALPGVVCEQCGEESTYRALKCGKCDLVFERGAVPNDFQDRCPECGFSKTEDLRKNVQPGGE